MKAFKVNLVSIILPCYNEKKNVIRLASRINEILKTADFEILIVDDNSPDNTYSVLRKLEIPNVFPILRTEDKGLANSIRTGIENAKGDSIVIMDSDFNHNPEYIPFLLENLKFYDCVSASRFLYGGTMDSRTRHLLSWVFNVFVRIMTGGQITDNLYGYFAIRKNIISKCPYDQIFWCFGDYNIRLLFYLQQLRCKILQFPAINGTRLHGRGNSAFLRVFHTYFMAVLKLIMSRGRLKEHLHRDRDAN
jgi:dolichol-phosphate mannosyltransferase